MTAPEPSRPIGKDASGSAGPTHWPPSWPRWPLPTAISPAPREWLLAIRRLPGYRVLAVNGLSQAPDSARAEVLDRLEREPDLAARRLAADLRARWGDPLGALERLEAALPDERPAAVESLRGLLDQLRTLTGRDARVAQGRAFELLAERSAASDRARLRLDAARAYTAAGDREAARRMLVGIADDRSAPGTVSAGGVDSTLVRVLIGEGKLDEAARRLGGAPRRHERGRVCLAASPPGAGLRPGRRPRLAPIPCSAPTARSMGSP